MQIGTGVNCKDGKPTYYAAWEHFPYPVQIIDDVTVQPNDELTATVKTDGEGTFTLTLRDMARDHGWERSYEFYDSRMVPATMVGAHIVTEAPRRMGAVLPLANFGSVQYSECQVDGQPLGNYTRAKLEQVPEGILRTSTSAVPPAERGSASLGSTTDAPIIWTRPARRADHLAMR